jgi:hypothetical protein
MFSTPFQYFVSLTALKIFEEGFTEWVPTHSSPAPATIYRYILRVLRRYYGNIIFDF